MPTIGAFRLSGQTRAGRVQAVAGDGAMEAGVAEGEDPPVRSDQPVTAPVGRRGDAHDRALEVQRARRSVELRGPEA